MKNYDSCFKSYDIRSIYQDPLDNDFAYNLGRGIGAHLMSSIGADARAVFASDVRQANNELIAYFVTGLQESGISQYTNIGLPVQHMWDQEQMRWVCSSSYLYYIAKDNFDVWVVFTASHNPPEYVGLKIVDRTWQLIPSAQLQDMISEYIPAPVLSPDEISSLITDANNSASHSLVQQKLSALDQLLLSKYDSLSGSYKIVVDFSTWASVAYEQELLKKIAANIQLEIITICNKADTNYSLHQSDTQVPHDYEMLIAEVRSQWADLGIMFDGDGDRLGFVDHTGQIIEWDIVTGIIASDILKNTKITETHDVLIVVHDVFTSRTVIDKISSLWGTPLKCRVWHTHVKKLMENEWAIFGGENSGHLFFPEVWGFEFPLLALYHVLWEMESTQQSLADLAQPYLIYTKLPMQKIKVQDTATSLSNVIAHYKSKWYTIDTTDGVGIYDDQRWFVLRPSNTEPVLKLVIEAENDDLAASLSDQIHSLV